MEQCFKALSDFQWQYIEKIVDTGRKRKTNLRMVVDAILWINRTGSQWRNIDSVYKPFLPIILYYYYAWQKRAVWEQILAFLVADFRESMGSARAPSTLAIDSQSVKSVAFVKEDIGVDAYKKIRGRKRHIMVDKFGLPFAIGVSGAEASDGLAGIELLWKLESNSRLELIRADGAYKGAFVEAAKIYHWRIEFGQKPEVKQNFIPQIGRWQVERSFAWLNFFRRLSKEYEKTIASSIAFLQLAFIQILLNRLENWMFLMLSISLSMIYFQLRFS